MVKFAQVVGVFPGPKFDDAEGHSLDLSSPQGLIWVVVKIMASVWVP